MVGGGGGHHQITYLMIMKTHLQQMIVALGGEQRGTYRLIVQESKKEISI